MTPDLASMERAARGRIFLPPPSLTLSEWADAYAVIPKETGSAEPGRWRTDRAPYLRGIMDAMSDPAIEEVVVMKASRVGYTASLMNAIGMWMADDPSNILAVLPDEFTTRTWSRTYLAPMLRDTPRLQGLVQEFGEAGGRYGGNATLRKEFPGGQLVAVWSSSANRLRNFTARRVVLDEIDGMERTPEGDPIPLAEKRAESFQRRRKILKGSSPTIKGQSRIERAFAFSDQRYFLVPCPACGHRQRLLWEHLHWDGDDIETAPETARYACVSCGVLIPHDAKGGMLAAAAAFPDKGWVATYPGRAVAGFHISALYSPFVSWAFMVREWLKAQSDMAALQTFFNTFLGETWEVRGEESVSGSGLLARREHYEAPVPSGVGLLTAAVDVQGDRFEVQVEGWGEGEENWKIAYAVLDRFGEKGSRGVNVTDPASWKLLDAFLAGPWTHASGRELKPHLVVVDSGAYTDDVYRYTAARRAQRTFAVKGLSKETNRGIVRPRPTVDDRSGARFWGFHPNAAKDAIYARLRVQVPGPRYVHLPDAEWVTDDWVKGLTSEEVFAKRGRRVYEKRAGVRNEPLDLAVMNLVALRISGVRPERLGQMAAELGTATPVRDTPAPADPLEAAAVPAKHVHRRRKRGWIHHY